MVVSIDRWTTEEYWLAHACHEHGVVRVDKENRVLLALHRQFPEAEESPLYIKVVKRGDQKRRWTPAMGEITSRFANRIYDLSTRVTGFPFYEIIGVPSGADEITDQVRALAAKTPIHPDFFKDKGHELDTVMVIEDTVTRADSLMDFLWRLIHQGKKIRFVCICFYRGKGGLEKLRAMGEQFGFTVHVIFMLDDLAQYYRGKYWSEEDYQEVIAYHERIHPYLA